jgi:predicted nuclease with TOPRIM domain
MPVDHLEHLEATINRLLERHEKTKREKEQLQKKLEQKESEWHHLRGQIRQYERERIEFKEKLDKIIGQFAGLNLSQ